MNYSTVILPTRKKKGGPYICLYCFIVPQETWAQSSKNHGCFECLDLQKGQYLQGFSQFKTFR